LKECKSALNEIADLVTDDNSKDTNWEESEDEPEVRSPPIKKKSTKEKVQASRRSQLQRERGDQWTNQTVKNQSRNSQDLGSALMGIKPSPSTIFLLTGSLLNESCN